MKKEQELEKKKKVATPVVKKKKPRKKREPTGNPIGRPTKYNPKFCQEVIDYMAQGFSIDAFAGKIDVNIDTIYEWVNAKYPENYKDKKKAGKLKHPEFSEAIKRGKAKSVQYWEETGVLGMNGRVKDFNSGVWIFNMKNRLGWVDKLDVKTTDPLDEAVAEAERELMKEDPEASIARIVAKHGRKLLATKSESTT